LTGLKNHFDKYSINQHVVYNYKSELTGNGTLSVCICNVILSGMRAERISCARHITLDWINTYRVRQSV